VFDAMLAQILKLHRGDLVLHLLVRRRRQADAARFGQGLQASSDVDTVAVEIAVLHNHIADVEANPENQAPLPFDSLITLGHAVLNINGAPDSVDHTGKFGEEAVPS